MYLIAIAWMYVAVLMAVAEASAPTGSILGAIITLVLYGIMPCAILLYILGTPERKRRLHAQRQQAEADWQAQQQALAAQEPPASHPPDSHGHAPRAAQGSGIAPVREEP